MNVKYFNEVKNQVGEWSAANFGDNGMGEFKYLRPYMGIFEELEELESAERLLRLFPQSSKLEIMDEIKDALGDICIYMLDFCYQLGVDVPQYQAEFLQVGEIHHVLLKRIQRIRNMENTALFYDKVKQWLVGLMLFISDKAERYGFDLDEILAETWAKVSKRDWRKAPTNGGE